MKYLKGQEQAWYLLSPGISKSGCFNNDKTEILKLRICAGESLEPHDMPNKVYFYVVAGKGVFDYDGVKYPVVPGDMIEAEPGLLRFWYSDNECDLDLLVFKNLTE